MENKKLYFIPFIGIFYLTIVGFKYGWMSPTGLTLKESWIVTLIQGFCYSGLLILLTEIFLR